MVGAVARAGGVSAVVVAAWCGVDHADPARVRSGRGRGARVNELMCSEPRQRPLHLALVLAIRCAAGKVGAAGRRATGQGRQVDQK